jgi:hypothetical protein
MRMAPLMVWLLSFGCTPHGASQATPLHPPAEASPSIEDTAWMSYPSDEPQPELSAEELGEAIQAVAALGGFNTQDIINAYHSAWAKGDEHCPFGLTDLLTDIQGCTSLDGYHFAGIGWLTEFEWDPGTGIPIDYYHGGDFTITAPDGRRMAGGGELLVEATDVDDGREMSVDFKGSWVDETDDGWLGGGVSGVLQATVVERTSDHSATLDGGLSIGGTALDFQSLVFDMDPECGGGLRGTMAVRDTRGYWTAWQLGDDCDACGELSFRDTTDLGELCVELDAWATASYAGWLPH